MPPSLQLPSLFLFPHTTQVASDTSTLQVCDHPPSVDVQQGRTLTRLALAMLRLLNLRMASSQRNCPAVCTYVVCIHLLTDHVAGREHMAMLGVFSIYSSLTLPIYTMLLIVVVSLTTLFLLGGSSAFDNH